ncbi:uncharacterized protein ASPGLDRAFT_1448639 [Aspergillus glaucus CBS 516.65]|uniref:DUF7053 domain-containing protein n=1 Tax=Aspergillus glaucus CBS 516.65 TaxID=1160497 RepID=A0A1L9VKQ7_ASPGL|nr:hypothetical protein ASPGLDRAFT_1448639 [Aspergillus glaucus CBS 516.65]OJJ84507.1 hypothetical protein ASPGLDRAFT_1448639 [Aspergillus glaucus CBS 516.65]
MKRTVFTTTTTLPATISRETIIDTLHNHQEMIELNPLVIRYSRCQPTPSAPDEEHASDWIWYGLTDRIKFLPGKWFRGKISYKGSFRDLPRGLRTHVYAPMGVDIRATWSVGGNKEEEEEEGEAGEEGQASSDATNMNDGLDGQGQGLYLREEVDLRCPFWSAGFVKKTMRRSHGVLVDRLIGKASHGGAEAAQQQQQQQQAPASPGLAPPPEIRINDVPASVSMELARPRPRRRKQSVAELE